MEETPVVRRASAECGSDPRDRAEPHAPASDASTDQRIGAAIRDEPDAAPVEAAASWADTAVVVPEGKERITIRLDRDIVDFFREQGQYQTRINAVLRAYVEHRKAGRRSGR
jgi:uncharacterized protein (DUF4415 family)